MEGITYFLFIWLLVPFVELGIIIVLAVQNSLRKQKIKQLTKWLSQLKSTHFEDISGKNGEGNGNARRNENSRPGSDWETQPLAWVTPGGGEGGGKAEYKENGVPDIPETPDIPEMPDIPETPNIPDPLPRTLRRFRAPKRDKGFYQGTAALIIGVIFVVLAGLIFATTSWHSLSSLCKAIMAFGLSVLFFGVSYLAGKVLKIRRTGQAFYVLGSVFLFVTVLAWGYFGLLGPEFILRGENRWRVLLAGSIVTEAALFAGLKSFRDRIYTQACLWGLTVSAAFLMGALELGIRGCINAMAYYSFLLVAWDEVRRRKGEHSNQNRQEKKFQTEFLDKNLRFFVPLHFWIFSTVAVFQTVVGLMARIQGVGESFVFAITPWNALAAGLAAAGAAIIALRRRNMPTKILHSMSLALFFQYAAFCVPAEDSYQVLIGAVLMGLWFLIERIKNLPLANDYGGGVFTAALALDTLFLVFSPDGMKQLTAAAAILLLAAVMAQWGRTYSFMRRLIPWVLFFLTVTVWKILNRGLSIDVRYDIILLAYVVCIGIWDTVRSEDFLVPVLAIGTVAQIIFWVIGWRPLPFLILLSVYLFAASCRRKMASREWHIKGSCLYSLAGIGILAESMTGNPVLMMAFVTAVFVGEYAVEWHRYRELICGKFWDFTGTVIFLMTMGAFYADPDLKLWNLSLCMASFAGFYLLFYRKGRTGLSLTAVLAVLPVVWVVWWRYGEVTVNQMYAWVGIVLPVTGSLFRYYRPIIRKRDTTPLSFDVDWFHILCILVLLFMAWAGTGGWRCAYTLLIGLYVLQYASLERFRRQALTLALALAALAFWQQPFVEWPDIIWLEIQLVPAALFIRLLAPIWKCHRIIPNLQTVLYCLCLAVLVLNALHTGNVENALVLEALCLLVFIWAQIRRCSKWVRISGIVVITVALYMTKDFWLSLSWWIYLLAAGMGLIIFAAAVEMRKH